MKKIVILFLILTPPVFSHGTEYSILNNNVIKIRAGYDSGLPFIDSEVMVFPPGKSEAEYSLVTDSEGIFYLEPDSAGTWVMQVRGESGHGIRINLDVNADGISDNTGNGLTMLQKIIMVLCVGWGAAGTVLYFRRGK